MSDDGVAWRIDVMSALLGGLSAAVLVMLLSSVVVRNTAVDERRAWRNDVLAEVTSGLPRPGHEVGRWVWVDGARGVALVDSAEGRAWVMDGECGLWSWVEPGVTNPLLTLTAGDDSGGYVLRPLPAAPAARR